MKNNNNGMFYTPGNVLKVIDPAAGSGGYLLTVATGSGKSNDVIRIVKKLLSNPPYRGKS